MLFRSEFLERPRRPHEVARHVLDGLLVLEEERVADIRGETGVVPAKEPAREILRDRVALDEAGQQALTEHFMRASPSQDGTG